MKTTAVRLSPVAASIAALFLPQSPVLAQEPTAVLPPTVVTATRVEQSSFDLPLSIDTVEGATLREQRLGANISETLVRVPGTVVQSRETYAQEQSLIIRGFGARSQFGVRGIKVLADGIPASTPDGQGSTGLFDLGSAERIEVLRGPFSALYGNHSGGVVQIFTEDGPERPTVDGSLAAGSYGTRRIGLKLGGTAGAANYVASISRLETDGYRDHSEARREVANVKLKVAASEDTTWTIVGNYFAQPVSEDPLGLTAAQMAADRRQANPAALNAQTRRDLDNMQGGIVWDTRLGADDSLRAIAYAGTRSNEQFLALLSPLANGVSAFDRRFEGTGLRWTHGYGERGRVSLGAEYEQAQDVRQGFFNVSGEKGALTRDEVNQVYQAGIYAQGEWNATEALSLSAGVRYTRVNFDSEDHFLSNGDNSGEARHSAWTPAVGATWKLTPTWNLYANAGRSFEAPTFIEIAFRPNNEPGLNFDLKASKSNHFEVGSKAYLGDAAVNVAAFLIRSSDEIVINTNQGGRATYQNAGDTERKGVELSLDAPLGAGFSSYAAVTWLSAEFKDSFLTCGGVTPPCSSASQVTVDAGNRIPGVPRFSAYGELAWRHVPSGFATGAEIRYSGSIAVDDRNSETTDAYTTVNLRAGFTQRLGAWTLSEFARVDNVFDEEYVGAVYVNDQNRRFYAPAPERNYLVGLSAAYRF